MDTNRKRLFSRIILILASVWLTVALSGAFAQASPTRENIRGTLVEETKSFDGFRKAADAGLYLPRQLVNGTLYGGGKIAAALSDPDFIDWVEELLYLYERDLAWFPILDYASGTRVISGGGLYYHHEGIKAVTRMSGYDSHYWTFDSKVSYERELGGQARWKGTIRALLEEKDNRRFFGFGGDPENDPRNRFLSDTDAGTYSEDRRKIQWQSTFYPHEKWGISYLGFLQRRSFRDHGRALNDFREVFDTSEVPGFTEGAPVSQIYNELSLLVDTRENQKMLTPGFRGEIHSGIAAGLGRNDSDLLRAGFDVAAFIPTVKRDRLLVPRIVMDLVEDLDETPIPFSEYPRQFTFRGVSMRDRIRNDQVSLVPSIEYQWPLSHMLSGHLFLDYLVVGKTLSKMQWDDGLWALGFGVNFHRKEKEFGRFQVAAGTEGVELRVSFGLPLETNERGDW